MENASLSSLCRADRKVAVLVEGDPGNNLGGACARDVVNMAKLLVDRLGFKPTCIIALFSNGIPAKAREMGLACSLGSRDALLHAIRLTVAGCRSADGTSLVWFHYSGHGFEQGGSVNESDGVDEAISPGEGLVRDDELYDELVARLPSSTTLIATMDCCHSGTALDLPYLWTASGWKRDSRRKENPECRAVSLSACTDAQMASQDVGERVGFGGSLTVALCESESALDAPLPELTSWLESVLCNLSQKPLLCSA
jgi:hypothetical protein